MESFKIVALGSSFAAGTGIPPHVDPIARRSHVNYPHLLAKKIDADLVDVTAAGATLLNVVDTPQRIQVKTLAPQLTFLHPDADLVLLTAGGNDLGYSVGMTVDSVLATLPRILQSMLAMVWTPKRHVIDLDELTRRLVKVIDRVHAVAPRARVCLIEYVTVFGSQTKPGRDTNLDEGQMAYYRELEHLLLEGYRRAARSRPEVLLIPMKELSQGHEAGAPSPWVTGFSWRAMLFHAILPYHPNAECHRAIANVLYERLCSAKVIM